MGFLFTVLVNCFCYYISPLQAKSLHRSLNSLDYLFSPVATNGSIVNALNVFLSLQFKPNLKWNIQSIAKDTGKMSGIFYHSKRTADLFR